MTSKEAFDALDGAVGTGRLAILTYVNGSESRELWVDMLAIFGPNEFILRYSDPDDPYSGELRSERISNIQVKSKLWNGAWVSRFFRNYSLCWGHGKYELRIWRRFPWKIEFIKWHAF